MPESLKPFSVHLFERLEKLYLLLSEELQASWVPAKDQISDAITRASFMSFASPEAYLRHERSKSYPLCIASRLEPDLFRVYFNAFSKKVYVDLNAVLGSPYLAEETRFHELSCEILRSFLFADPLLLSEEQKTEAAAEIVVATPEIIIIPED